MSKNKSWMFLVNDAITHSWQNIRPAHQAQSNHKYGESEQESNERSLRCKVHRANEQTAIPLCIPRTGVFLALLRISHLRKEVQVWKQTWGS